MHSPFRTIHFVCVYNNEILSHVKETQKIVKVLLNLSENVMIATFSYKKVIQNVCAFIINKYMHMKCIIYACMSRGNHMIQNDIV